jgi:hypothetical protein
LPSLRFIRFAKITVLVANIWTLAYAALVFGWQTFIFFKDGSWQALPLSFVFDTQRYAHGEIDATGSIDKIRGTTNFVEALLRLPILTILLLAAAFLSAFYLWLYNTEKRLTNT